MRTINFNEEDIKQCKLQCKLALAKQNLTSLQSAFLMQYITNIEQENKQLKDELKFTIGIVEHNRIISEKNKEIHQLKDNWNKLKEFIVKEYYMYLPLEANAKSITILIDKMQELEGSDSNE